MLQEFSTDEVSEKLIRMDIKNRNIIDEDVDLSIESKKQPEAITENRRFDTYTSFKYAV